VNGGIQSQGVNFLQDVNIIDGTDQLFGMYNYNGALAITNYDASYTWQSNRMIMHPNGRTEIGNV
jgi:hypothetical protein